MLNTHIRWMIRRDMPEVLDIANRGCEFPWEEEVFVKCLRQRNCIGMVAETPDERIAGFMVYDLHKHYLHILNIAVHPDFHRQGVGRQMVRRLMSKLAPQRRTRISLVVRETNLDLQLFFRACGFQAVSVLREHWLDSGEDAYEMQYRLPQGAAVSM